MHTFTPIILIVLSFSTALTGFSQTNSGFAESSDKTKIAYHTYGSGYPILIINGGPGMNSKGFEELAIDLSKMGLMTITYDQRGTGESQLAQTDSETINMSLMLDDIEAIRKHLNIDHWHVMGHSFGGMMASLYASKYPAYISKLVLSSSGGIDLDLLSYVQSSINSKLTKKQIDSVNYYDSLLSRGDTSYVVSLRRALILAHAYVANAKYVPAVGKRLTQRNIVVGQLIWQDMVKTGFNCAAGLSRFNKPVLIIQGKNDIVKAETAYKAKASLSNATVVLIDHAIHYGWLDNPTAYFGAIRSFIFG